MTPIPSSTRTQTAANLHADPRAKTRAARRAGSKSTIGAGLAAFPTITALTAATPGTLSGAYYIYVFGYAAPNDGGEGFLFLIPPEAPNGITIYNDASGNSWSRVVGGGNLSVAWAGAGMSNGSQNDCAAIQNVHNLALKLGAGVDFPAATYYVTNSGLNPNSALLWDLKVPARAIGRVTITSDGTGTLIQLATDLPTGNAWYGDVFAGDFLFSNTAIGGAAASLLFYVGQVPGESQSRLGASFNIRGITASGWGTCVMFGSNAYTMQWEDCFFKDSGYSGTVLNIAAGCVNSGEKISFYGCDFAGNFSPVMAFSTGGFEFNFVECSIDYNAVNTLDYNFFNLSCASVSVYTVDCHFEWGYGPYTLTGASISGTTLSCASTTLPIGAIILDAAGEVAAGTVIEANLGSGDYTISQPQTIASETMTANCPIKLWNFSGPHSANIVSLRDSVYYSQSGGVWQNFAVPASVVEIHGIRYCNPQTSNPTTFLAVSANSAVADVDDQFFADNAAGTDPIAAWVTLGNAANVLNTQFTRVTRKNIISANYTTTPALSGQAFEIEYASAPSFTITLSGYTGNYFTFIGGQTAGYTAALSASRIFLPGAASSVNNVANFIAPGQVVTVWFDGASWYIISNNYKSSAAWALSYGPISGVSPGAFTYTATAPGFLQIYGGAVSALTSKRGSTTIPWNAAANMLPVLPGDIVTVTNSIAPALTLIPG